MSDYFPPGYKEITPEENAYYCGRADERKELQKMTINLLNKLENHLRGCWEDELNEGEEKVGRAQFIRVSLINDIRKELQEAFRGLTVK